MSNFKINLNAITPEILDILNTDNDSISNTVIIPFKSNRIQSTYQWLFEDKFSKDLMSADTLHLVIQPIEGHSIYDYDGFYKYYCDKSYCSTIYNDSESNIEAQEVLMDNHLLKNNVIRKLRGNHYLILSVLHIHDKGLTLVQLKKELTSRKGKCCLSDNTLSSVLKDLLQSKYISCNKGLYKLIDFKNYGAGFTKYYYSATILLINGIITQQEYLVYLCLVRNLQQNKNVTYA